MDSSTDSPQEFASVPVIDAHLHPVRRALISDAYEAQARAFAGYLLPPGSAAETAALLEARLPASRGTVMEAPRRTGYFNYVARSHGVSADLAGFDAAITPHIGSDAAFTSWVGAILARENIAHLVMQADSPLPGPEADPAKRLLPPGRVVWTGVVSDMTSPGFALARGLTDLDALREAIFALMEAAVAAGIRGFKDMSAYERSLGLTPRTPAEAEAALRRLCRTAPGAQDPADLRCLHDYLMRAIYIRAGELERPVIIHTAVALHPGLKVADNDPRPLYQVFMDPGILRAGTRFVLIHGGYPMQDVIACYISQFPNVFTDVSFYAKYPAALSRLYAALLGIGPATKILHGSDANTVPEEIGYCAWNSRQVLEKTFAEFRRWYGWTARDANAAAEAILFRNALKVYGPAP